MRLAFLISAHTDARHLARLVGSLPEEAGFYVHIDRKSDIAPFRELLGDDPRVVFLERRTDVIWGSLNEVEYQMELIRAALGSVTAYDYMISMSGMDYPLWSNSRITDFFREAGGREILQGLRLDADDPKAWQYTLYRPFSCRHWRGGSVGSKMRVAARHALKWLGVRKPLRIEAGGRTYSLYKGAAWWAVTPQLARVVLGEWDNNVELRRYFKTSFCPAETFIQTVAFNNSDFAPRCILTEGHYTTLAALTPLTFIDYNPTVQILTEKYYEQLIGSGKMFCRKTVTGRSDRLMDMIDTWRDSDKRQTI